MLPRPGPRFLVREQRSAACSRPSALSGLGDQVGRRPRARATTSAGRRRLALRRHPAAAGRHRRRLRSPATFVLGSRIRARDQRRQASAEASGGTRPLAAARLSRPRASPGHAASPGLRRCRRRGSPWSRRRSRLPAAPLTITTNRYNAASHRPRKSDVLQAQTQLRQRPVDAGLGADDRHPQRFGNMPSAVLVGGPALQPAVPYWRPTPWRWTPVIPEID
ncbi:hypothetical protein ACRAWD_21305 [Caulobacter segnis]